jgi:hypothetical protein
VSGGLLHPASASCLYRFVHLHPVVRRIRDIEPASRSVAKDAVKIIELIFSSALLPPLGDELAGLVEHLNAVVTDFGDEDVVIGIHRKLIHSIYRYCSNTTIFYSIKHLISHFSDCAVDHYALAASTSSGDEIRPIVRVPNQGNTYNSRQKSSQAAPFRARRTCFAETGKNQAIVTSPSAVPPQDVRMMSLVGSRTRRGFFRRPSPPWVISTMSRIYIRFTSIC